MVVHRIIFAEIPQYLCTADKWFQIPLTVAFCIGYCSACRLIKYNATQVMQWYITYSVLKGVHWH